MQSEIPFSPAGSLVVEAADRINFTRSVQDVLQRLSYEDIHFVWQLEYLDSNQWENLGASMGLVASVRKSLEEWKAATNSSRQQQQEQQIQQVNGTQRQQPQQTIQNTGRNICRVCSPRLHTTPVSVKQTVPQEVLTQPQSSNRRISSISMDPLLVKQVLPTGSMMVEDDEPGMESNQISSRSPPTGRLSVMSAPDRPLSTSFPPPRSECRGSNQLSPLAPCYENHMDTKNDQISRDGSTSSTWTGKHSSRVDPSVASRRLPDRPTRLESARDLIVESSAVDEETI